MSASSSYLETEQPVQIVDSEMTDILDQTGDIEMTDAPEDRNVVSSEDGLSQLGRGRPQTFSVDQSNLCNSSDAMSRGGESIPHGQEDLRSDLNNRGGNVIHWNKRVYRLAPQELAAFNAMRAAREHQCSSYLDGEHTVMVNSDGYECDFCDACEEYLRIAGQDNGYWSTVPF
jgi:hypothetical protein